jgi:hypothetical protein
MPGKNAFNSWLKKSQHASLRIFAGRAENTKAGLFLRAGYIPD